MVLDTTQQLGWAYDLQGDPWTGQIDAVDALYWKFGVHTIDMKDFHPTKTMNWEPIYKAGTRNPADMQLPTNAVAGHFGFFPTSGVPAFLVLGGSSTAAGTHTVVNIDTGELPTFTVRSESTGGTVAKYLSSEGCKAYMLNGYINFLGDFPYLSEVLAWRGLRTKASTALNATHTTGTKHCTSDYTMTGTERAGRYHHDLGTPVCTWNSQNIVADLGLLNYSFKSVIQPKYIDGQEETDQIDEGKYAFPFSLAVWRGNTTTENLHTDFLAGTQRTFIYKIFNGATYYRQYTWSNVSLLKEDMTYAQSNDKKLYTYHALAEDFSLEVLDGVSDTYYED